jgi:hypothetical protein
MDMKEQIARVAAMMIVDEGLEYGPAKKRAVKHLQLERTRQEQLPDNDAIEAEVRLYLEELDDPLHALALRALRDSASQLMERLERFRPHLTGAVWRGTATQHSDIHLQLFEDDSKMVEMELANLEIDYAVSSVNAFTGRGMVEVLSFTVPCKLPKPQPPLALAHVALYTGKDERGALKHSANGMTMRGNLTAVRALLATATQGVGVDG